MLSSDYHCLRPQSYASWSTSCTSQQDDRYITLMHFRNRFLPATATARQLEVNAQTIRNRLRQNNVPIRARKPYTGPIFTARHRAARLLWAQRHLHNVIFRDESWFSVSHADGRVRVYRRRNERYAQCFIRERDRFGGGSVMVWGGIMGNGKTDLVVVQGNLNAQRYVNLLNNNFLPYTWLNFSTQQRQTPYCSRNCKLTGTKQRERFTLAIFMPGYESYRAHFGWAWSKS